MKLSIIFTWKLDWNKLSIHFSGVLSLHTIQSFKLLRLGQTINPKRNDTVPAEAYSPK